MTMLTFKEMCAKFDVTPRSLRYYEYIELLSPVREGRSRLFGPREVARMTLILRGRRFGFSLEEIRQWLEVYDKSGTRTQMEDWVVMADRQIDKLDKQIAELHATLEDLRDLRNQVAEELENLQSAPHVTSG
ncbi:MerR family transcriptional regulator [Haematobacter massiliensis]|uniref:MerR family transcriptional regulator n=1 Tax=Haematobacter massiliensis TaxID=195105 RepID=A0A086YAN0_9RHOB|nr:MerR family DNA-binding transcriptional regulator [Haematobacter massiliensis]KFI31330.1 MerR family transcriptional regulator [Haematobacter massiliensis]OWJ87066.1 MerR family transcriptional regulator [Haematobacter massiliensis]